MRVRTPVRAIAIVAVAVFVVAAAAGFFIYSSLSGTETYTSDRSGLQFSYPAFWEEMSPNEWAKFIREEEASGLFNEVALVDDRDDFKVGVAAGSIPMIDPSQWDALKSAVVSKFQSVHDEYVNITVPFQYTDCVISDGSPGIEGKVEAIIYDEKAQVRFVYALHGTTVYVLTYLNAGSDTDADAEWREIKNSIRFTK